jgi:hypothetical protein
MVPRVWASANMIKLSEEWSYLFYVLWFEDKRYPGEPIQHNIVFQDHCYIHNSQETYEKVFGDIAFHVRRMEIILEDSFKKLDEETQKILEEK